MKLTRNVLLLGLGAIIGLAVQLRAEPSTVAIALHGEAGLRAAGVVTAKAIDGRAAPVEVPFTCSAQATCLAQLDLPDEPSGWVFSVSAPGYWGSPATVSAGGVVELWPTGRLEGEIRTAEAGEPITELIARFSPSPGSKSAEGFPDEGNVTCPVREARFECAIPAGTYDLRLRAKGHVSVYRWRQALAPGATLRLGSLGLQRGASLVGRVVSSDRDAPKPGSCTVRLEPPAGAGGKGKSDVERPRSGVDGRGFFHLEVIPAGSWVVVAEQQGFAAARRAVNVLDGMEANLKDPLVLGRPARLELILLPPQDPDGKSWMVELVDASGTGRAETIATVPASLGGFWSKDGLSSGRRLMVRIRTSAGQAWWADTSAFELTGPTHRRTLEIGFEEVAGTIQLGDQPLPSTLTFGAPEENLSISVRSGSDGRLSGTLPRLGKWRVLVSSDSPSVSRQIDVDVPRGSDGKGRVDIVLEDRALTGEIVDENGKRLDRAILTISRKAASKREMTQERVEGGQFRLTGYEPGGYLLRALGAGRVSKTVSAEIAADGSSPFLKIVAVPKVAIDLRLVNENGSPIPAAKLSVLETTVFPGLSSIAKRTDGMGRVSFTTHPDVTQQCFAFNHPGLPTRIFAVSPDPDEQEIVIPAAGGAIEVEKQLSKEGEALLLWQGPCYMPMALLKMIAGGDGARFPSMSPGDYRLCRQPVPVSGGLAVCDNGYLAPGGILTLKVGSPVR